METIGQRIKKRRIELGLSQRQAAIKMQMARSYLNHIEHDRHISIGTSVLIKIADVLETNTDWLVTGKGSEEYEQRLKVPLIQWEDVGKMIEKHHYEKLPLIGFGSVNSFVVMNECDSMYGVIRSQSFAKGDLLYFDPDKKPKVGDFVLVKKRGEIPLFRQLLKENERFILVPLNPQYPIIRMTSVYKIEGVLVSRVSLYDEIPKVKKEPKKK